MMLFGLPFNPLRRFQKSSPLGKELPAFGGNVTSPEGYLLALWLHECRQGRGCAVLTECSRTLLSDFAEI